MAAGCGHDEHAGEDCGKDSSPTMTVPSRHSCWVCASREEGYIGEPDALTKAQVALQDATAIPNITSVADTLGKLHQRINLVAWAAIILLVGATAAEARRSGEDVRHEMQCFGALLVAIVTIGMSVAGNTIALGKTQNSDDFKAFDPDLDKMTFKSNDDTVHLAETLSQAIRCKTVSYDPENPDGDTTDYEEFLKLHRVLQDRFPLLHQSKYVIRTVVNNYSLIYEWKGKSKLLPPIMFCAHLDVVPTPYASSWSIPDPFAGKIDDNGVIWGRGAIDNKHNVVSQLAALETLLAAGVERPDRTVYICFGHDEELGGTEGAEHIATEIRSRLDARKQHLAFLIDEGTFLIKNILPGLTKPIALIGTTEKGMATFRLSVSAKPSGHSSMPEAKGGSNIGILASAIKRLEQRPCPPRGLDYLIKCWQTLGSELPVSLRILFGNPWLFRPLLKKVLLGRNATAASIRTTTAVTIIKGGSKFNVLPGEATAIVNHRIHPADGSYQSIMNYDRRVINDPRVSIELQGDMDPIEPSPITPIDSSQFRVLKRVVRHVFDAASAPNVMIGNTDTQHYWGLHEEGKTHIFRFSPVVFESVEETKMFHGVDERISVDNLRLLHNFYLTLLYSSAELDDPQM